MQWLENVQELAERWAFGVNYKAMAFGAAVPADGPSARRAGVAVVGHCK